MIATWTLPTLVWPPICAALILGILVIAIIMWRDDERAIATIGGGLCIGALLIGTGVGFWPWSAQYHQWQETTGTVATVSSRILGSKDSFSQKFVVRYTDGRERSCMDTRCSLVKPGDLLTVTCKRSWQYAGQDGWDCNYVDNRRP